MKNIKKVLAAVLMIAVMFSITGCNSSDYKKAAQLMADGDYAAASEMFKALGDYEDSADQAKECDYQIAKAAFDAGDYENAIELLTALGDYQDSADLISQATDKVLSAAAREAKAMKDDFISVEHLFLGLLDEQDQTTSELFRAFNLKKDAFLQQLTAVRGNQRVTTDNPEDTYNALQKYGQDLVELARKQNPVP